MPNGTSTSSVRRPYTSVPRAAGGGEAEVSLLTAPRPSALVSALHRVNAGMRTWLAAMALVHPACLDAPGPSPEAPDAAGPATAADEPADEQPVLSCDQQFGAATGYLLCSETTTTCAFTSELDGDDKFDCNQRCAELGATCVTGFDANGSSCEAQTEDGCAYPHETQICVCRRT